MAHCWLLLLARPTVVLLLLLTITTVFSPQRYGALPCTLPLHSPHVRNHWTASTVAPCGEGALVGGWHAGASPSTPIIRSRTNRGPELARVRDCQTMGLIERERVLGGAAPYFCELLWGGKHPSRPRAAAPSPGSGQQIAYTTCAGALKVGPNRPHIWSSRLTTLADRSILRHSEISGRQKNASASSRDLGSAR